MANIFAASPSLSAICVRASFASSNKSGRVTSPWLNCLSRRTSLAAPARPVWPLALSQKSPCPSALPTRQPVLPRTRDTLDREKSWSAKRCFDLSSLTLFALAHSMPASLVKSRNDLSEVLLALEPQTMASVVYVLYDMDFADKGMVASL